MIRIITCGGTGRLNKQEEEGLRQDLRCVETEHYDLLGIHYGSHSHSERHGGNLGEVVPKETSVCHNGVLCQCFHSGSGNKAGAGLVKGDVAVRADTFREDKRDKKLNVSRKEFQDLLTEIQS